MPGCNICARHIEENQLAPSNRLIDKLNSNRNTECDEERCILKNYADLMMEIEKVEQEWKIACANHDIKTIFNILAKLKRYCPIIRKVHDTVHTVTPSGNTLANGGKAGNARGG